jgi:hypothetical protein
LTRRKTPEDLSLLDIDGRSPMQFAMDMAHYLRSEKDPHFLEDINPERIQRYFFVGQGWRLTGRGDHELSRWYQQFVSANPENEIITGKVLLNLDAAIRGPWRIRDQEIIVYDPAIHFEIQMVDGSAHQYAEFRKSRL